jgi:hypothetical protein
MEATEKKEAVFCKVYKTLNVKICPHCRELELKRVENKSMADKILDVLQDNKVHSLSEIVEMAGLMEDDVVHDFQRSIRVLRDKGLPVECVSHKDSLYKLLTREEEERTRFWDRQAEKRVKTKEVLDLEATVAQLKSQLASAEAEVKFLTEYCQERDAEIERLKHGFAANARAEPASVSR